MYDRILKRIESLPYNEWRKVGDHLQSIKTIIDTRREHGIYIELSNDYTKFRKLDVNFE